MPIETEDAYEKWFLTQAHETCIAVSSRAALRVWPLVGGQQLSGPFQPSTLPLLTLATAWAILAASVAAMRPSQEARTIAILAHDLAASLAHVTDSGTTAAIHAADLAARSTISAGCGTRTIDLTARAASRAVSSTSTAPEAASICDAVDEAGFKDATSKEAATFVTPLWRSPGEPLWLEEAVPSESRLINQDGFWSFWREWYQGFLDGKPLDWELQRRVAVIPDADWALGPEHIAQKIEEIRRDFAQAPANPAERNRELEPASLANALQAPTISAAQIESAAQDIREAECRYLNDTGENALPEEFKVLPGIAQSLTLVGAHIRQHATDPTVEEDLRQEVGRLNARIVELEVELQRAQTAGEAVFSRAFREQAGKSLGDWKMYAAVLGSVWLVSGDVVGLQERLENLQFLRERLFGPVGAPPEVSLPQPFTTKT